MLNNNCFYCNSLSREYCTCEYANIECNSCFKRVKGNSVFSLNIESEEDINYHLYIPNLLGIPKLRYHATNIKCIECERKTQKRERGEEEEQKETIREQLEEKEKEITIKYFLK